MANALKTRSAIFAGRGPGPSWQPALEAYADWGEMWGEGRNPGRDAGPSLPGPPPASIASPLQHHAGVAHEGIAGHDVVAGVVVDEGGFMGAIGLGCGHGGHGPPGAAGALVLLGGL